jgi:hypothetical protein
MYPFYHLYSAYCDLDILVHNSKAAPPSISRSHSLKSIISKQSVGSSPSIHTSTSDRAWRANQQSLYHILLRVQASYCTNCWSCNQQINRSRKCSFKLHPRHHFLILDFGRFSACYVYRPCCVLEQLISWPRHPNKLVTTKVCKCPSSVP